MPSRDPGRAGGGAGVVVTRRNGARGEKGAFKERGARGAGDGDGVDGGGRAGAGLFPPLCALLLRPGHSLLVLLALPGLARVRSVVLYWCSDLLLHWVFIYFFPIRV